MSAHEWLGLASGVVGVLTIIAALITGHNSDDDLAAGCFGGLLLATSVVFVTAVVAWATVHVVIR